MAMTDRPTIINLALHSYFNLDGSEDILDHQLQIESDFITTLDPELIPTGEIRQVTDTPYDFRTLRPIWYQSAEGGVFHYDQNFMLRQNSGALNRAATVKSSRNGLSLEVWTSEPCIQFYDAKNLNVPVPGIGMKRLTARAFASSRSVRQIVPIGPILAIRCCDRHRPIGKSPIIASIRPEIRPGSRVLRIIPLLSG
jgi:galactose mutarotase-like enzyme